MDFDDLDDEIDKRVADGEQVLGFVRENRQPAKGTVLEPMERSMKLPSDKMLPGKIQTLLPPYSGEPLKEKKPLIRLLAVYGAGDSVAQAWCFTGHDAPPEVEMATFEFPGHGIREDEPFCESLQKLGDDCFEAFREAMDTGPFALLGHSIGCLVITYVAERAKRELNVDPLFAFMLERGPPHLAVLNDFGYKLLREEPVPFLYRYQPTVAKLVTDTPSDMTRRMANMWHKDLHLENDTREIGFYKFPCPIMAFVAMTVDGSEYVIWKDLSEDTQKMRSWMNDVRQRRECKDGRTFCAHFQRDDFDGWSEWTDLPDSTTVVECRGQDHMSIKVNPGTKGKVFGALQKLVEKF